MKRLMLLSAVAWQLSSCSEATKMQGMCEASLKDQLINPETAEFFEFTDISKPEAEKRLTIALAASKGLSEKDIFEYREVFDQLATISQETIGSVASKHNAAFKEFRVKADSKMGNKVTVSYVCAVSESNCFCFGKNSF